MQSAIQKKKKKTDVMKEKLNPLVEGYRVFFILQTFVKQEKFILKKFDYFFF